MNEEAIFVEAIEKKTPEQRAAYLDQACGDDETLRVRVEALLRSHETPDSLLDDSPPGLDNTIDQPSIAEGPGSTIGPYKLLQQIGEGGMGVVYMAEQRKPVKRRVALKIIKPGMDTNQVIARFEAERQALAMMDHPNIARVLDAGTTTTGRPYFVMELVNGISLTRHCDEQRLTPAERLELFLPVCQAVQHAHQKGIIHRDLKPSNVLIALYDGRPVPKVIDFGVAKAMSQTLTERTMFTQLGQIVGTIEYMSPEQAQRNQLDIDTRSDIYSLGVLLYELLTGDTPFDRERLRSAAFDELLRIVREEEPPRPSTKLSSNASHPSVAANRRLDLAKLSAMVRGELDWIVMKAMEKNRNRRYATANALANDVGRYLHNEPVTACPPTPIYRLTKIVQRHKIALVVCAIIATTLVLGSTIAFWQRHLAVLAKTRAVAAETETRAALEAAASAYMEQGSFAEAEHIYRQLISIRRKVLPSNHPEILALTRSCARSVSGQGRTKDAIVLYEELLDQQNGVLGHDHPNALSTRAELAELYAKADDLERAVQLFEETISVQTKVLGAYHSETKRTALSLYDACLALAWRMIATESDDTDRCVALARRATELWDPERHRLWNSDKWQQTVARSTWAMAESSRGENRRAIDLLDESVDFYESTPWFVLAMANHRIGNAEVARDWYAVACEFTLCRQASWIYNLKLDAADLLRLPDNWPNEVWTWDDYADAYTRLISQYPNASWLYCRRAYCNARLGRWEEADRDFATAIECKPRDSAHWASRASLCLHLGKHETYAQLCGEALKRFSEDDLFDYFTGGRTALICALSPNSNVSSFEALKLAHSAQESKPGMKCLSQIAAICAYRCGEYQEVIDVSTEGNKSLTAILTRLFKAMALAKLGDARAARLALSATRIEVARVSPTSFDPNLYGYVCVDNPAAWCMLATVLAEAEQVVSAAEAPQQLSH